MNKRERVLEFIANSEKPVSSFEISNGTQITKQYVLTILTTSFGVRPGLRRTGLPREYKYSIEEKYKKLYTRTIKAKVVEEPKVVEQPKINIENLVQSIDLDLLADKIANILVDKLAERLGIKGDYNHTLPKIERKKKLKTITVAGLLPNQAGMIQEEFCNKFDVRFWTKDQSAQQLKIMAKGSDHVIAFVSKMGHWADKIISENSTDFTRVSGGMTQLRKCLESLNGVEQ